MDRRAFLAVLPSLPALATTSSAVGVGASGLLAPSGSQKSIDFWTTTVSSGTFTPAEVAAIELRVDVMPFRRCLDDLREAIGDSPLRKAQAQAFLLGDSELGPVAIFQFRDVPAEGTATCARVLDGTDELREFTRALRAGLPVQEAVEFDGHGDLRAQS